MANEELISFFLRVWKDIFDNIVEDPAERAEHFEHRWRDYMNDPHTTFFHESPTYYIAPELIPQQVLSKLSHDDKRQLIWEIQRVLELPDLFDGKMDTKKWAQARNSCQKIIDRYR